MNLIIESKISNPILISGDVHIGELLHNKCSRYNDKTQKMDHVNIFEITSSGLTHSISNFWIIHALLRMYQLLDPDNMTYDVTFNMNFGEIEIHWNNENSPTIFLRILSPLASSVPMELEYKLPNIVTTSTSYKTNKEIDNKKWNCVSAQPISEIGISILMCIIISIFYAVLTAPVWLLIIFCCIIRRKCNKK